MQIKSFIFALIPAASAHFRLNYPTWRADSLALEDTNPTVSQWNYPCAGIGQETSSKNRTAWPLDGGSVVWNSSHDSALSYVNLALGEVATSFNISLVPVFNETGAGVICLPKVGQKTLAALNLTDGTPASIQVITLGHGGTALYNCADIVFRKNATVLSGDQCKNATGVSGISVGNLNANGSAASGNGSSGSSGSSGSGGSKSGAAQGVVPVAALFAAVGAGMYAVL